MFLSKSTSPAATQPGCDYAKWAQEEVIKIFDQPSVTTIQCCLILCVIEVGEGLEHQAWLRVGHAARLAQLARLHKQDLEQTNFNWGQPRPTHNITELEVRRRTFWCTFCLEKLLANGRDRIATLVAEDITTRLPQADEDFIFGRERKTIRLTEYRGPSDESGSESLFSHTIRIINILANISLWHGRGGRRRDFCCPWLPDSPFNTYTTSLAMWKERLPSYWDFHPSNISLVVAAGQGKMWSLMFMFYFQAKTYLYREYLLFMPSEEYDPAAGQ